jgi:hypothetical protein
MNPSLDRFILNIPRLFIKQYPYAWFPLVVLWTWPPNLSLIFLAAIVIGLLSLRWQYTAWMAYMRREYAGKDGKFYVDRPAIPWGRAVRNITILLAGGGLIASLLNGQLGLTFWQLFLIFVGFMLTYQDYRFFGASTTYIITATGIAVYFAPGHLDYRLFFTFNEIARIERTYFQKDKNWDFFARSREVGIDGLLLIPKDIKGFSKRMEKLFIAPQNIDKFIEQLPYGYK